jgi:SAM-dependent methyltransferase
MPVVGHVGGDAQKDNYRPDVAHADINISGQGNASVSIESRWSGSRPTDDVTRYLQLRWNALGEAGALFCRPVLDLDSDTAQQLLDPDGYLGDLRVKDVLCLAGGGGRQSIAFGLLGARVTVLDLDRKQLERDREAAAHHKITVRTEQGDMRDLSRFKDCSFDIVWHPYSINFVPEFELVVSEVARVLRPGGVYTVMMANPFASGIGTRDVCDEGYVLRRPYIDGAAYEFEDEAWVHDGAVEVPPPREFRHTLGKVVRVLADAGFMLFRLDEAVAPPSGTTPGTWEHLKSLVPPWLTFWARKNAS